MGLADRDYIRRQPPGGGFGGRPGGPSSPGTWSVNTWLIVICAAIFAIDSFLPIVDVPMGAPGLFPGVTSMPSTAVQGEAQSTTIDVELLGGRTVRRSMRARPIYDRPDGEQIGWQRVRSMQALQAYLHFSTYKLIRLELWRLIGFQFLHAGFDHILFNMIGLFFFGPMVERHIGGKRYLAFYLLCGIFGALLYGMLNLSGALAAGFLGTNLQIPGLIFYDWATPLIGASAGVFGVIMAGAYLAPNSTVLLMFIIPIKLRWFAYLIVGLALWTVIRHGSNAGGEAGHLGGAFAGWFLIRRPHLLHGFFDILGRVDPTSHHYRTGGKRKGRPRGAPGRAAPRARGPARREVDRILDKVQSEGLASLTEREKRILHEASEHGTRTE